MSASRTELSCEAKSTAFRIHRNNHIFLSTGQGKLVYGEVPQGTPNTMPSGPLPSFVKTSSYRRGHNSIHKKKNANSQPSPPRPWGTSTTPFKRYGGKAPITMPSGPLSFWEGETKLLLFSFLMGLTGHKRCTWR